MSKLNLNRYLTGGVAICAIVAAMSAHAQAADGQTADAAPTDVGTISATGVTGQATGGGLMIEEDAPKSRSTVGRDFIQKQSPTQNPEQLLELVPGANVSSTDAFGLNGGNIVVRGLNSDQLGFTIEGVPVNDSGNYAIYPQEYLDAENLEQIVLSQGSPDIDSPHIGAVGGIVNIYITDPSKTLSALGAVSYGSGEATRVFARLDTGEIGNVRAFASYSHFEDNQYRGAGSDERNHIDFKAVDEFGTGNRVTFSLIYNNAVNNSYRAPTLSQFLQQGYGFNYDTTFLVPPTPNAAGVVDQRNDTNYYKIRVNPFANVIMSGASTFNIADNLTFDIVPYFWYGYGNGGGSTAINEAGFYYGNQKEVVDLNGNNKTSDYVLFYTPSITETYRPGAVSKLTYQWDNQKIIVGYWYEHAHHRQSGPASPIDANGNPENVWGDQLDLTLPGGAKYETRDQLTMTVTNSAFASDSISLMNDKLQIDLGIKQVWVTRDGYNYLPGATPFVKIDDNETLPTGAVRYKLDDANQIFGSISWNFRTPQNYTLFDTFSTTTGAKTNVAYPQQAPEKSISVELGWRYQDSLLDASITGFGYNFRNRLVQTTIPDPNGTAALITVDTNVGRQRSRGVDAEMGFHPIEYFRPYVSFEYLSAKVIDNYQVGADYLPTAGKIAVRSPKTQAGFGLDYDDGHFFFDVIGKYVGKQYSSFMDDEAMGAYFSSNITAGYRFDNLGWAQKPEIRVNLMNLPDHKYLSGVSGTSTNALATRGINGTTIAAGFAPSYYEGAPTAVLVTIASKF